MTFEKIYGISRLKWLSLLNIWAGLENGAQNQRGEAVMKDYIWSAVSTCTELTGLQDQKLRPQTSVPSASLKQKTLLTTAKFNCPALLRIVQPTAFKMFKIARSRPLTATFKAISVSKQFSVQLDRMHAHKL